MSTMVFDLETTNEGPEGSPEAHHPANEVLAWGWRFLATGDITQTTTEPSVFWNAIRKERPDLLVAHNAKFDYKWLLRTCPFDLEDWLHGVKLTCTMTHHYLATGQESKFISLEALAEVYDVKAKKTFDLGKYLEDGGTMRSLGKSDLLTYLGQDVNILCKTYFKMGLKLDTSYIKALAEMEMAGLPIDRAKLEDEITTTSLMVETYVNAAMDWIVDNCEWTNGKPVTAPDFIKKIKPTANRTLSFIFFDEPKVLKCTSSKHGQIQRKEGGQAPIIDTGMFELEPTNLGYPMSEDAVAHYATLPRKLGDTRALYLFDNLPEWRENDKLLNTYYLPFYHKSEETGCVHPKLNTTVTATARLSSSAPNGQNLPPKARALVRPPIGFKLINADFSQLELVALAKITKDARLNADLSHGVDIHYLTGRTVFGWRSPLDMRKDERRKVKNLNFGVVYGGRPKGLSEQTGFDIGTVEKLRNELLTRYPGIEVWQEYLKDEVNDAKIPNGVDHAGNQMYKSLVHIAGKAYCFQSKRQPDWMIAKTGDVYGFNPNQIYNYGIQGYAGHVIMMKFLSEFYDKRSYDNVYAPMLITVHDSLLLQVKEQEVKLVSKLLNYVAEEVKNDLRLPQLNLDIEVEDYWT